MTFCTIIKFSPVCNCECLHASSWQERKQNFETLCTDLLQCRHYKRYLQWEHLGPSISLCHRYITFSIMLIFLYFGSSKSKIRVWPFEFQRSILINQVNIKPFVKLNVTMQTKNNNSSTFGFIYTLWLLSLWSIEKRNKNKIACLFMIMCCSLKIIL